MYIRKTKDFKAGLLFLAFGVAAMVFSTEYRIGTSARMGPGYFPFVLGGVLTLLGLVVSLGSLAKGEGTRKRRPIRLKPAVLVLSSVVLFGLLLQPLGLVLATIVLIMTASVASDEFNKKEAVLNTLVLLAVVLIVFVYLLQFQIPVLPSFLAGRL
jgi:uncharacterized membrane protein YfcA